MPHGRVGEEIECPVEMGFAPAEAIRAAMLNAARSMDRGDEHGQVRALLLLVQNGAVVFAHA